MNEDAFRVQAHPLASDCWLCLLADGMGGQAGGGPAAQLACRAALDAALACRPEQLLRPRTWSGLLQTADAAVAADPVAGFTTLVGLCVYRNQLVGASSGDSAALLVSGGKAVQLTAAQHKNPPLGCGGAVIVPFSAPVAEPWRALVMSDGVWKYVGWDRIVSMAQRWGGGALLAELQQSARLTSGAFPDDFTVVVLEAPCAPTPAADRAEAF